MSDAITAIATISATIIIVVGTGLLLGSSHRVPFGTSTTASRTSG